MDCLDESDTKWRYQVINHGTNEEPHLAVHEAYFDVKSKEIWGYTETPINLSFFDTEEELETMLRRVSNDLKNFGVLLVSELEDKFEEKE